MSPDLWQHVCLASMSVKSVFLWTMAWPFSCMYCNIFISFLCIIFRQAGGNLGRLLQAANRLRATSANAITCGCRHMDSQTSSKVFVWHHYHVDMCVYTFTHTHYDPPVMQTLETWYQYAHFQAALVARHMPHYRVVYGTMIGRIQQATLAQISAPQTSRYAWPYTHLTSFRASRPSDEAFWRYNGCMD